MSYVLAGGWNIGAMRLWAVMILCCIVVGSLLAWGRYCSRCLCWNVCCVLMLTPDGPASSSVRVAKCSAFPGGGHICLLCVWWVARICSVMVWA